MRMAAAAGGGRRQRLHEPGTGRICLTWGLEDLFDLMFVTGAVPANRYNIVCHRYHAQKQRHSLTISSFSLMFVFGSALLVLMVAHVMVLEQI
jgi:hypothetical protein